MIVVGYLYNKNGMATWCIEAALALQRLNHDVVLIKSPQIQLPDNYPVKVFDFETKDDYLTKQSLSKKIIRRFKKYSNLLPFVNIENDFLIVLNEFLETRNISPEFYLLNQTSFVNKKVSVPQYVVAWSYKPFLYNYLKKVFILSEGLNSFSSNLYGAFYWHKMDWIGYRNVTGVLSVSEKLTDLLQKTHIKAYTVYPGSDTVKTGALNNVTSKNGPIKLVVMALSVDDKRKGFKNIIETLKRLKPYQFELTLIGACSQEFKQWVLQDDFPAVFTGLLPRDKAVGILNGCDVLLFGSLVDDWGFVQVEAMARSMAVLSPRASPFDEIVGRDDYLYNPSDETDLESKLKALITAGPSKIEQDKAWFKKRYEETFSSDKFGKQLTQTIFKS